MSAFDPSVNERHARTVTDEMLRPLVRDLVNPVLQAPSYKKELLHAITEWATSPETLVAGDFASRVTRLPSNWAQACLEALNRKAGYASAPHHEWTVRLRNFSPQPVAIVTGIDRHPLYDQRGKAKEQEWDEEKIKRVIHPGEVIEVGGEWGANALYTFSRPSWPVTHWRRWPHDRDCLRDVGYSFAYQGRDGITVRVDSNQFKRDGITDALKVADDRADDGDFDGALSVIGDVSHYLIDGEPVQALADKRAEIEAARDKAKAERPKRGRPRKSLAEE